MAAAEVSSKRRDSGGALKSQGGTPSLLAMRDVVIGAGFGCFEKPRIAAVFVRKAEAVQRPAQAARPAGIAAVTLLRALAQKFAGLEIENSFLRRGAVAAHQVAARGEAMAQRNVAQPAIARFTRGIKNDADVHHDVDEERILADERAQVLPVLLEAQRLGFARLNQRLFELGILRQAIPAVIRGHEDEAEIVNIAIVLARGERRGVAHGLFQPEFVIVSGGSRGARRQAPAVEDPHHAGKKPVAPVGPYLAFVLPFPFGGVHRIEARMSFDELAHLLLCEPHSVFKERAVRFQDELDHALWILAAWTIFTCMRVPLCR